MSDQDRPDVSPEEPGEQEETFVWRPEWAPEEPAPRPRRYKAPEPPAAPTGYRATRRASKAARSAKREQAAFKVRQAAARTAGGVRRGVWVGLRLAAMAVGAFLGGLLLLYVLVVGVNAGARWLAVQKAGDATDVRSEQAKENLLVVGAEDGRAHGFLALRVAAEEKRVFGLAIPDGAFVEVPGQGFERIGDSFHAGADVSMAAVSNYLSVPFRRYIVVDVEVYEQVMQKQSVAGLLDSAQQTDLSAAERVALEKTMDATPSDDVLIVALPVKPISLGEETYFEPRRQEVADLIESWWGVTLDGDDEPARIIVYNGSGVPGIAGVAAQQLIHEGFRVVDTKNADHFGYAETMVIVQHPGEVDPAAVKAALGVGKVIDQPSEQRIADVIVIIGKDYAPPQDG